MATNRRKFLKRLGLGGVSAGLLPSAGLLVPGADELKNVPAAGGEHGAAKHAYNGSYAGEHLNRIAFPMGGMGAGMFCVEGTGAVSHMSVRHKPEIFNEPGIFAAVHVRGVKSGAKVLEGPVPDWKKFGLRDAGNGLTGSTAGLPRFANAVFQARFPFSTIDLSDNNMPCRVQVIGWSPFIPGDDDNSSLPVAAFEYRFENTSGTSLDFIFSFNSRNFLRVDDGRNSIGSLQGGFVLSEEGTKAAPWLKSDFAMFTDDPSAVVDHCWFRGGWWDPLTMAWNAVADAQAKKMNR